MFSLYGGLFFGGGGRRRKAPKKPKKKKENWFVTVSPTLSSSPSPLLLSSSSPASSLLHLERLTVDQNKQLCKAAKLRHVGKKNELIERLCEDDQTSIYACEVNYIGLNVEQLKDRCRQRNLQVSGSKFDLVLRILHCDNGTTPAGATLKRAATDVVTSVDAAGKVVTQQVPKKRKKATPSPSKTYNRVQKKIEAVTQRKYQSHWGSKTHSSDVYSLVGEILQNHEEDYLSKDPRFVLKLAEAAISSLTDNFETMERKGYDDDGGWSTIDGCLRRIVEAAKPVLSAEEREETAEWIEALHHVGEPYGVSDGYDLLATAEYVRGTGDQKSEKNDTEAGPIHERKPAAAPVPSAATGVKAVTDNSHVVKENVVNSGGITM